MLSYSPLGYADPFALMRRQMRDPGRVRPAASGYPAVNVWQGSDSAAVTAELPGVAPDDLDISVKDNVLTISGERRPPETEKAAWLRRERLYGRFSRVVQLPFRVDRERVEARFENGVLQIELHRPEEDKPRRINIKAA